MKHTPGPWKIEAKQKPTQKRNVYEHGETFRLIAKNKSVFGIATIDGPSNFNMQEELRANARLIAAAPDLLEACKSAFSELWNLYQTTDDQSFQEDFEILTELKNAIEKAES